MYSEQKSQNKILHFHSALLISKKCSHFRSGNKIGHFSDICWAHYFREAFGIEYMLHATASFSSVLDSDNFEMGLSEAQRKEFCLSNCCAAE